MSFDLLGPLPTGTVVLEASAGTGKTFTIAALVTRYVAEQDLRLEQLLVVTFGRAATQELRDRVRDRLVSARDGLRDPGAARSGADLLLAHLATTEDEELQRRRDRLARALASFDAATIATTHQFCQQVLASLGTAGDNDAGAVLVEDLDDLVTEVVDDLYLRRWGRPGAGQPDVTRAQALELAQAAVRDAESLLVPLEPREGSSQDVRRRFASAVRAEVDRRKRQRRLLGFDDLLTRLRDTLDDGRTGAAAAERVRGRYSVVLVDEFQDTDPVQWQVLRLAFHGTATLVLIGDPKQAIYAFRGADVQAYLEARELADHVETLGSNWRSDAGLLAGLDRLLHGAALGDERIVVHPVVAGHPGRCLDGPGAPVQLRLLQGGDRKQPVRVVREHVAADVAAEVVELLESRALLSPRDGAPARPVGPGDVAVVVRDRGQVELVQQALLAAGVPSVQRTSSSVFRTPAARDWLVLLEALEQPHRTGRVRRLALTDLVGWTAAGLDTGDVDGLALAVRSWLRVLDERGVAAVFDAVCRAQAVPARLLGRVDGERRLTDLRHVAETLHAAALSGQLGLTATLEWLRRRVAEAGRDGSSERSRRLDSDAAAVQVVTVHASKGLEFPVVHVPYAWDRFERDVAVPLFHDADGRRVRDVGGNGPGFGDSLAAHEQEELGEDLRLLYVALTRAQARVTLWWAPSVNTPSSPLHRLLMSDGAVADRAPVPPDARALEALRRHALEGALSVEQVPVRLPLVWLRGGEPAPVLELARLVRSLDDGWRRTSYSALTASAHDTPPVVSSEPELWLTDDEPDPQAAEEPARGALGEVPSPMAELPGGTGFGTLVHGVLEHLDPTRGDLEQAVREQVLAQHADDPDALVLGLLPSLTTPLGPLAGGRSLAELDPRDRLSELDFELPLVGGERPGGELLLEDLAPLLRSHGDDVSARYADLLPADTPLRGYLGGSIDAVLRVDGRYLVVDYKTNRLAGRDEPLTAWHYRRPAMVDAMLHAHYPLQALLYDVALHRYLRWRLPSYDPAQHLGGVLYLFLRGMCGPGVVEPDGSVPGVFDWQPPPALVVALSDLLARGRP